MTDERLTLPDIIGRIDRPPYFFFAEKCWMEVRLKTIYPRQMDEIGRLPQDVLICEFIDRPAHKETFEL